MLCGDTPTKTHLVKCDTDVDGSPPIKQRFYHGPADKHEILVAEVKYMLDNRIAVSSSSSAASPCLLFVKSDGSP